MLHRLSSSPHLSLVRATLLAATLPLISGTVAAQSSFHPGVRHAAEWREKMVQHGRTHAESYRQTLDRFLEALRASAPSEKLSYSELEKIESWNQALGAQYYDAGAVFYRIATLDTENAQFWRDIGGRAVRFYRDYYILPTGGRVPGFRNFTDGLLLHHESIKRPIRGESTPAKTARLREVAATKEATLLLSRNAAFARDDTAEDTADPMLSREVAYAIRAMLHAEALGEPRRPRLTKLVNDAIHHLEVLLPKEWPTQTREQPYTKPFMIALTARALIEYAEVTGDKRIPPLLAQVSERLWARFWDEKSEAFLYSNRSLDAETTEEDGKPAPDLNLLIAPLYSWVGKTLRKQSAFTRFDAILDGGLKRAYWGAPKQFNQNGWWSFDGIEYRDRRR